MSQNGNKQETNEEEYSDREKLLLLAAGFMSCIVTPLLRHYGII